MTLPFLPPAPKKKLIGGIKTFVPRSGGSRRKNTTSEFRSPGAQCLKRSPIMSGALSSNCPSRAEIAAEGIISHNFVALLLLHTWRQSAREEGRENCFKILTAASYFLDRRMGGETGGFQLGAFLYCEFFRAPACKPCRQLSHRRKVEEFVDTGAGSEDRKNPGLSGEKEEGIKGGQFGGH